MPVFLRLAFHDAGTYDASDRSGGANASIFHEIGHPDRPEHTGLEWALEQIKDVQENGNHITAELSLADIIQLGAIAAVQYTGGPVIKFKMGRIDATQMDQTRLLDFDAPLFSNYERMGFNDREIAAVMGCHALGKANPETAGVSGRWTMNPYVFDRHTWL